MTCSTAVREPSTTIVRREMCASWVRPMLRLSMAKPRCLNRLTTRLSVPGDSSIVATSVCLIWNHLRKRSPRDNHRVHALLLRDAEIDQIGPGEAHRRLDRPVDLARGRNPTGRDAVGIGQLDVVR